MVGRDMNIRAKLSLGPLSAGGGLEKVPDPLLGLRPPELGNTSVACVSMGVCSDTRKELLILCIFTRSALAPVVQSCSTPFANLYRV